MVAAAHKTVIITGSNSGIGLTIAEAFAAASYKIMLNGLPQTETAHDDLCAAMRARGATDVIFSPADMRNPDAIASMVTEAHQRWQNIDVLINNAGIQHVATIEEFPRRKWDDIIAINLSASFHTMQAVIPFMRKNKFGRIINIASAHALVASPHKAAYVAAKHGVLGLTKVAALELAESGITCNAICPGFVDTPLVHKQLGDLQKTHNLPKEKILNDIILGRQPTKRLVKARHIAALALFLCTAEAEDITGAALPMDGAWTAR